MIVNMRTDLHASSISSGDGILLVDKPIGPTSHDIVHRIRKTFQIPKVGHGGTLDPMASGLLILLLGKATKLSDRFLASDKTYEGTMTLGSTTDTLDAMGETIDTKDFSHISSDDIKQQMQTRRGDSLQTPPMASAVKVNGVPLYKHARKGKTVERKPRLIHVYKFDLTAFSPPTADFILICTKGTYVRVLCAEIGESLGCGAHLSRLRRTQSGKLSIHDALPFHQIMEMSKADLLPHIRPMGDFI
jgi:tRNA pseudouridine55 synthase